MQGLSVKLGALIIQAENIFSAVAVAWIYYLWESPSGCVKVFVELLMVISSMAPCWLCNCGYFFLCPVSQNVSSFFNFVFVFVFRVWLRLVRSSTGGERIEKNTVSPVR